MNVSIGQTTTDRDGSHWLQPARGQTDGSTDPERPGAQRAIRLLVRESRTNNAFDADKFRARLYGLMGMEETVSPTGEMRTVFNPAKKQVDYRDMPIREVTRELIGADRIAALGNSRTGSKAAHELRLALREAAAPITASQQQDVNAWSVYTGGLIELKFKEGYDKPEFIGSKIIKSEPTATNGNRIIGEASMNLPDGPTGEGQEYPNQTVAPRWIFAPPRVKYGQKAALTREAIAFGLGGILMAEIQKGGTALGYLKEYLIAATCQGINIPIGTPGFKSGYTTNTFQYDGLPSSAANATFQTSATAGSLYNYVNKATGSAGFQSWADLQAARYLLSQMREPETGYPILAPVADLLVCVGAEDTARNVQHATQVWPTYGTSGITSGPGGGIFTAPNPFAGNQQIRLWSSPIWDKVKFDSGVSATNALDWWQAGDFTQAFKWLSVWEERITQANDLSSSLVERDILAEWVYSWFGVPVVYDPHYILLYTN